MDHEVFSILTWLPLVTMLTAQLSHLKVYDFSEKTMTFYCPDGSTFKTESSEMGNRKRFDCTLKKASCWQRGDGCSAGGSIMNNQFLVILINLYLFQHLESLHLILFVVFFFQKCQTKYEWWSDFVVKKLQQQNQTTSS